MKLCEEEVPLLSIKGIQKDYLFCQNGVQKGKGMDLGTEPRRKELYRVYPGR